MAAAQICVREKGSDICPFHPGHKVVHECEDCRKLVCSSCVTSHHKKHSFRDIKLAVNEKVDNFITYIQNTKQQNHPDLIQELNDTTKKLQDNNKEYEDVITKANKQSKRLIADIEEYTAKTVDRLEFLQKKNNRILERHLTIIEKLQSQLEKRIKDCELCIKTYTDIEIYYSELPSDHPVVIPNHQSLISSAFTPCTDTEEYIKKTFGDILEFKINKIPPGQSASKKPTKKGAKTKLKNKPKTLHESDISFEIMFNSICLTPDNMAWARRDADSNQLYLVDGKGAEHRTLELDVDIEMMCVDPTTGKLYCSCQEDNSIRRISTDTGETTVMFYTLSGDIPCDLGCLYDDRMVVSTVDEDYSEEDDMNDLELQVYTITGTLLYSYTYNGMIPYLSVCPQTNTIALMSGEQVTVLNDTLQEVYTYQGKEGLDEQFMCVTAVFVGEHLLVGDCCNYTIHILTAATRKWIKSITTDSMSQVVALGVQQNGVLWVGCQEPNKLLHIKCFE